MSGFNARQIEQLLRPINPTRILNDGKGHAHVSQQDVVAHLIRCFGFGAFDLEIIATDCLFDEPHIKDGKEVPGRRDVCYRALVRLTIRDDAGNTVCRYEDGSTATAQNQPRGDAHDLALKSAISLAKKRTAINLGDNFGLSLYNRGQAQALVRDTLVKPDADDTRTDVQDGVPEHLGDIA